MSDLYHDLFTDTYGTEPMAITLGIDTSSHQGAINWAKVGRTSYRFAVVRMSIGRGTRDTQGRADLRAALDNLPVAGGYGVVGVSEPVEDGAKFLLDEIATITDPKRVLVMLDAENFDDGSHPTIGQVDRYAQQLHSELGRWPIAYVPGWWLAQHGYGVAGKQLANCPWAPSRYISPPWSEARLLAVKPTDLKGFKSLGWLQYTSSASAAGVNGNVDANCFYGTLADLKARLLGQQEDDMTQDEHDALMWLRQNVVGLRDAAVRMTDHGDPDVAGRGNNLEQVREDIASLLTAVKAAGGEWSPQQIQDLGNAIANALLVKGGGYTLNLTGEAVPKAIP